MPLLVLIISAWKEGLFLYMSSYSSHLLQSLDISCFTLLKQYYGQKMREMMQNGIHAINKMDFLSIYRKIHHQAFLKTNMSSGFAAAGCYRTSHDNLTWQDQRDHWMIRNKEDLLINWRKYNYRDITWPLSYPGYTKSIPKIWSEHTHNMTRIYPRYDLGILRIGSGWIYKNTHFMYLEFSSLWLF